jgi:3-dehydroquinate synthase class II
MGSNGIMAESSTSFKKGVVANSKGRKKGSLNKKTKNYVNLKKLAADDYCEAYKELREAMKMGEGWAHNLFFKELVPKKVYTDTILVAPKGDTPEARIAAITRGLQAVDELTHSEAMEEIKTFSKVKEIEEINKDNALNKVLVKFLASADTDKDKEDEGASAK